MKISWGYKITILYVGFVGLIVCMVSMAMRQKVDLVSKDYYEQELNFQDKINKTNRSNELSEPLRWELKQDALQLKFPAQFKAQKIAASVYFFRPSDSSMDKTIPLSADSSLVRNISTEKMQRGLYKIQINWNVGKEEYYNEGIIQIN
ncbi:MAG: hypothetical protein K0Q95_3062 [Bacteroidota bacterium]|jgi:hypothetical protein|nr:hypothetical protein [Bacteroidota bacterium]